MSEELVEDEAQPRNSRTTSSVSFPYVDLDEAVSVARRMHTFGGGMTMDRDQVGAAIQSAGGTFSVKLSAARQFGLIESVQNKWSITDLGFQILDEETERQARAEAFPKVELFRKVYEEFRGKPLPGKLGLENSLVRLGVAQKQKEKARQTLERSARQAGYFPDGNESRLVAPIIAGVSQPAKLDPEPSIQPSGGVSSSRASTSSGTSGPAPEFLTYLLSRLPPDGEAYSADQQAAWLGAVAQMFKVAYKTDPQEAVEVKVVRARTP